MIGVILAASLPADMPEDQREAIMTAADQLPLTQIIPLMADAQEARALLDSGDRAGAAAIINRHRETAVACGLAPLFDQMMAGILPE